MLWNCCTIESGFGEVNGFKIVEGCGIFNVVCAEIDDLFNVFFSVRVVLFLGFLHKHSKQSLNTYERSLILWEYMLT